MANLYVLEGKGDSFNGRGQKRFRIHRGNRRVSQAGVYVPGIMDGSEFLGSIFSKLKSAVKSTVKVVASPVTASYSVAKAATKATTHAVLHPSVSNVTKIATKTATRAGNETVSVAKEAGHAVAETGRAAGAALDVTRRVAKRLIKSVAKKVLFKGSEFLGSGSVAAIPKNAAKGVLIPVATAAVVANTVTAPAAPVVPVLVNEVIDELYSAIENKIKAGLSPSDAASQAKSDLDKLEPGEENDPKVGSGYMLPLLIGGGILAAFLLLKKK